MTQKNLLGKRNVPFRTHPKVGDIVKFPFDLASTTVLILSEENWKFQKGTNSSERCFMAFWLNGHFGGKKETVFLCQFDEDDWRVVAEI